MNKILKINLSVLFFLYQNELYAKKNLTADNKNIIYIKKHTLNENTYGAVNAEIGTGDFNDGYVEINWGNIPCFIQRNTCPVFFLTDNIRCILIIANTVFDFNCCKEVGHCFGSDTNTINYDERRGETLSGSPLYYYDGKMVSNNFFSGRTLYVNSKITRLVPQGTVMIHYNVLSFLFWGAVFYIEKNKFRRMLVLPVRRIKREYILLDYVLHLLQLFIDGDRTFYMQRICSFAENSFSDGTISDLEDDFSTVSQTFKDECGVVCHRCEIKKNITVLLETWGVLRMNNSYSR